MYNTVIRSKYKMGTAIYGKEGENPSIKRFSGGSNGVCYNIKIDKIMTKKEYLKLLKKMIEGLIIRW